MKRSTRYRLTLLTNLLMAAAMITAIAMRQEGVAVSAIGAQMTILSVYIWGRTVRKE